jgi:dTDP-4-amino-4,6-dideoxygalactose transaminase
MVEEVARSLREEFFVGGESVERFEEEFATYVGTEHAVAVSSGTDALTIALRCLNVTGTVITSPMTFVATAESVVLAGCKPRFADINPNMWNIDPAEIEKQIGSDTQALLPVHLYGMPCDMRRMQEIASEHDLIVIEDAAQAHGTTFQGAKIGSIGRVGCFSFYSTKNLTVGGNGGMITTDDADVVEMARLLREHGGGNHSEYIGYNARMNTINAAFGRVQLRRLDGWIARRRAIARIYQKELAEVDSIKLPVISPDHVYHLFVVQAENRDGLKQHLREHKIFCGVHYPVPVNLLKPYREYASGPCPNAERHAEVALSLPMYPDLSDEDVHFVCDCIREFYGE